MNGKLDLFKLDGVKLDGPAGGSNIKSIQKGQVSLTTASQAVTITNVDTSKTIVLCNNATDTNDPRYDMVTPTLTNGTTLTLTRGSGSGTLTVNWIVIEFNNVKSLQTGVLSSASSFYVQTTVAYVNVAKSILFDHFIYLSSIANTARQPSYRIVDSTTLEFCQYANANSRNYWQLIEFN